MVRSFCSLRKPSADDSVLLIVEVYYSHTKNLDVVDKAREHSDALVILPPHSTRIMQPLDVVMHKKLKRGWAALLAGLLTPFLVCKLFGTAYRRAATMRASVNSFIKTGHFPFNRLIPRS